MLRGPLPLSTAATETAQTIATMKTLTRTMTILDKQPRHGIDPDDEVDEIDPGVDLSRRFGVHSPSSTR